MQSPFVMRQKLMTWNPQWDPQTIEAWSNSQLSAVYHKELIKTARINIRHELTKSIN